MRIYSANQGHLYLPWWPQVYIGPSDLNYYDPLNCYLKLITNFLAYRCFFGNESVFAVFESTVKYIIITFKILLNKLKLTK